MTKKKVVAKKKMKKKQSTSKSSTKPEVAPVKKGPTKIPFSVEVDAASVIYRLIEKCGMKKILVMLQQACWMESGHKIGTVMSLLANEKDVENIEFMILLIYILNKKKELLPEAEKHWAERVKLVEDSREHTRGKNRIVC